MPLLSQAANEIAADSIVMDCEDGVAANMKEMARETIALMLDGEQQQASGLSSCIPCRSPNIYLVSGWA